MNDFGINLRGKHGVFKEKTFYKPKASVRERTFLCVDGPGCDPDSGNRKITGRWLSDSKPDTISSFDFEVLLLENGRRLAPIERKG